MLATLSIVVDLLQPGRVYDGVAAICADYNVVSPVVALHGSIHEQYVAPPDHRKLLIGGSGIERVGICHHRFVDFLVTIVIANHPEQAYDRGVGNENRADPIVN